ncbi:MAG TPA: carboxylesterase/lipase family protein [Candidatus Sulfotelmatobacter sp.]|nr:carboxylesterase/lipase family protein [Candidatus Sulfotelmatobacter sp.]
MNRPIVCLFAIAGTFAVSAVAWAEPSAPQVKTLAGVVEGKDDGTVRSFLGIPYAQPPVGDLRWKAPVAPAKWKGVRKATEFGPHCLQGNPYGDMVFRDSGGSEDCLSLNIWVPSNPSSKKLPVMVWIYGGGFVAGATSEGRQDGTHLAQQGVIVVSMNYRLNVFGFLVHPQLAKESPHGASGNYGLMDQLLALHWVHDNIAAFGGDPGNVTIFGESAGSFSVSAQMASPLTKGLFNKAIGESGGAFSRSGLSFDLLAMREEKDSKLVKDKLGVSTLAEMRALPAEKLLDIFGKAGPDAFAFGPNIDGYFLPDSVPAIFAAGKQNDVPLLAGWNHDEDSFEVGPEKPTAESMKAMAEKDFGDKAPEFLKLYPTDTPEHTMRSAEDYAGDKFIALSTWAWIEAQSKTGKHVIYRYRFDMSPPATGPNHPNSAAYHSAEIEYVFGQLDSKAGVPWRTEDRALSEQMMKYWSNFAKNSDPNGPGLPKWPKYISADGWPVMFLSDKPEAHKDELRERYVFLESVWKK